MEEYDQKLRKVFDQFGITIPCSATYFLEVGARFSLKVATNSFLRGKRNLAFLVVFVKQKRRSVTKKFAKF